MCSWFKVERCDDLMTMFGRSFADVNRDPDSGHVVYKRVYKAVIILY